jgi:putative component of membrane protein insertase Oxa1/YidC/SpoIIIJ protein YidD
MQISLWDSCSRRISTAAITGYQKHISPHKGFACAHRVLYGGESCSQYIKRTIAEEGLSKILVKSRNRFQACKQANQILRSPTARGMRSQSENPEMPEDDDQENLEKEIPAPQSAQKSSFRGYDCIDCGNVSCDCAEILTMIPDCSSLDGIALDCSGADCSSLDCGAADCGSLDCGGCSW